MPGLAARPGRLVVPVVCDSADALLATQSNNATALATTQSNNATAISVADTAAKATETSKLIGSLVSLGGK